MCLARDRLSRFLQFLTSQLVPLFSVFGPGSVFKIFAVSNLLVTSKIQRLWPEIFFQDFRSFSSSSSYKWSKVFGPRSAFKIFVFSYLLLSTMVQCVWPGIDFEIFAVSHLPDSTVVQCVWPEIGFQDSCIFSPSNSYNGPMCLARDRLSRFV